VSATSHLLAGSYSGALCLNRHFCFGRLYRYRCVRPNEPVALMVFG
jgi:hypothetical protein